MPYSLSLPEVVELQTNSDDQLEEGQEPQQSVAGPDGSITAVRRHYTQLQKHTDGITNDTPVAHVAVKKKCTNYVII